MKKLILISAIATVLLSSCGHDYIVRSIDTNNIVYMNDSQIGDDTPCESPGAKTQNS